MDKTELLKIIKVEIDQMLVDAYREGYSDGYDDGWHNGNLAGKGPSRPKH